MTFVQRWNIQKLTAEYQTLYYDGCEAPKYDGWSTDPEDALEWEPTHCTPLPAAPSSEELA